MGFVPGFVSNETIPFDPEQRIECAESLLLCKLYCLWKDEWVQAAETSALPLLPRSRSTCSMSPGDLQCFSLASKPVVYEVQPCTFRKGAFLLCTVQLPFQWPVFLVWIGAIWLDLVSSVICSLQLISPIDLKVKWNNSLIQWVSLRIKAFEKIKKNLALVKLYFFYNHRIQWLSTGYIYTRICFIFPSCNSSGGNWRCSSHSCFWWCQGRWWKSIKQFTFTF